MYVECRDQVQVGLGFKIRLTLLVIHRDDQLHLRAKRAQLVVQVLGRDLAHLTDVLTCKRKGSRTCVGVELLRLLLSDLCCYKHSNVAEDLDTLCDVCSGVVISRL